MTLHIRIKTLVATAAIALLGAGQASAQANLFVSEFKLTPEIPVQGQPVTVRIGVYNNGNAPAGPFRVEWWPGENYASGAECSWNLAGMVPNGGRILNCTYAGYPSWYGNIRTRIIVDAGGTVDESNEVDNDRRVPIRVNKPAPAGKPNLFISEMSLDPATPVQGQPVNVRIGVYNNGAAASGPNRVAWWPGENYPASACGWNVGPLPKNGGRILNCTYPGYPSWYGQIRTRAAADVNGTVDESNEGDNARLIQIQVGKP